LLSRRETDLPKFLAPRSLVTWSKDPGHIQWTNATIMKQIAQIPGTKGVQVFRKRIHNILNGQIQPL
jgi:hypothetical protein